MSVLQDLADGRIKIADASTLMGLGRRQVFRLAKAYGGHGPQALVSRRRGRPSNRCYPTALRAEVIGIVRERYCDFGPTLAAEKLAELHGIHLARETLRQWMMTAGLWKDRRARLRPVHQPRYRRDCVGELIQIDGSEHWWFEGRGPQCTLLVYIDDASSRLMHLQFVESESTFDYFVATRAYLERHGKPVAFYSDKHVVFRVNKKDAIGGDGMTQFGRALHALNIDIICANSSQAKGRVERANGTLQDRLVKEMRLCGIDTIAAGNAFLPAFIDDYNARFAKAPLEDRDVHRPLAEHDDLDDAFAWREERSVSMNLTLQYDQVLFILEPTGIARSLARKRVTGGWRSGTTASICPTAPSTSDRRSTRPPLSRTSALVRSSPTLPRSRRSSTCHARPRHRAGAARRITCSRLDRSAEPPSAARCAMWRLHAPLSPHGKLNP